MNKGAGSFLPPWLLVGILLGGCSPKPPVTFTSPTGGYSFKVPASYEIVTKTATEQLDLLRQPLQVTTHFAGRTTNLPMFITGHADLPREVESSQVNRLLLSFMDACGVGSDRPLGEQKVYKVNGYPALEGVTHFRVKGGLWVRDGIKDSPMIGRCVVILAKDRLILMYFGVMEAWKFDSPEGPAFFNSLEIKERTP